MILLVSSTSSLPSSNPPDPTRLQMLEGTSESQPASPALSRLADFGRARVRPRIILHCLPSKIEKNIIRKCQKMSSPWWKNTFYVWFFYFTQISWWYRRAGSWQLWLRSARREGDDGGRSFGMNRYHPCLWIRHPITWPLITAGASLKKKKKMIKTFFFFQRFVSLHWMWRPYAEPLPHYSRQPGQRHLYAAVMKTAQRPREKATVKWERRGKKTGGVLRKEGQSWKWNTEKK